MNEIIINTEKRAAIPANSALAEATAAIASHITMVGANLYAIASRLADIENSKLYEQGGFASTVEYAAEVFGLKKSAVYSFVKIGKEYTNNNCIESNLPHEVNLDFSISQVTALLPLKSRDKAVELINAGEIRHDMTVAEIKDVVKFYKGSKSDEATEGEAVAAEDKGSADSGEITIDEISTDPRENVREHIQEMMVDLFAVCEITMEFDEFLSIVRKAVNDFAKDFRKQKA